MSNKGDCRTAPATPGLLTRQGSPVDSPLASPLSGEVSLKDKYIYFDMRYMTCYIKMHAYLKSDNVLRIGRVNFAL